MNIIDEIKDRMHSLNGKPGEMFEIECDSDYVNKFNQEVVIQAQKTGWLLGVETDKDFYIPSKEPGGFGYYRTILTMDGMKFRFKINNELKEYKITKE